MSRVFCKFLSDDLSRAVAFLKKFVKDEYIHFYLYNCNFILFLMEMETHYESRTISDYNRCI